MRPGALTALLGELARAPEAAGWSLPISPGERIGRFEILREVGHGGFGVVYEARDAELGRSVAFKAVRTGSSDAVREQRALAEAEAAARLAHPNIVHLYDVGRCERGPYLIMELLRGETLDERLARGPLPVREAVHVATEIARGVAHAHAQGVVHRDLKPGNVFVCEDGQVKVLDFGLAHVFGRGGVAGGTPAYMAPEQGAGEAGDERSDVYALGVIVHELVTGKRPFEGNKVGVGEGEKAPELRGAPAALARLVARTLARDPAGRPAGAGEVLAQLVSIQRALEPKRLLWAAAAVALAAVIGAAGFAWMWQRPLPPGRLLTAIADTDNQTDDPDLDGASELIRSALGQSARVSIMARSRLVNIIRQAGGAPPRILREPVVRDAAASASASVLIAPAVRRAGTGLEVTVRTVDLGRGGTLGVATEFAGAKAMVPAALERLVTRVRRALGEEKVQRPRRVFSVEELAPANPEALRHFAEGKRLDSEGRFTEATRAYLRALAADPAFLPPRVEILRYSDNAIGEAGLRPLAEIDGDRKVLRDGMHRLPERERAYAEVLVVPSEEIRNQTEYLALLERAIEAWPEDPRPYEDVVSVHLQNRGDLDAAAPYIEKAIALAPLTEGTTIDFLVVTGRLDEALQLAIRWTEAKPGWPSFNGLRYVRRFRGEFSEALEAARRMLAFDREIVPDYTFIDAGAIEEAEAANRAGPRHDFRWPALLSWPALRGRIRDALAVYDAERPLGRGPAPDADAVFSRSFIVLAREDPEATWREAEKLFRVGAALAGGFQCHALQLTLLGDDERALRLSSASLGDGLICHRLYVALRAWRGGDRDRALSMLARIWAPSSHLYRGEILAEMGRHREAIGEIRTYRRQRGFQVWDAFFDLRNYPRSLYLEAASLEALGEREEARRVLGVLLELWKDADPDLPLLARARALRARLAAGAR